MGSRRCGLWIAVIGLALSGCGSDLGECDEAALGGPAVGAAGLYTGQIVMSSCGSGFCHASNAFGEARRGAPSGLDFDVASTDPGKLADAIKNVRDYADDIWSQVEAGTMPPPMPAGGGELDEDSKEALRNWLACDAPLADTGGGPAPDAWSGIHPTLGSACNGCHGSTAFSGPGNGFLFGEDACTAYQNVVNQPAITMGGMCDQSGLMLVAPGDPAASLLLQKLEGTQTCGTYMPLTDPGPYVDRDPTTVSELEAWIADGAPPPEGCTP